MYSKTLVTKKTAEEYDIKNDELYQELRQGLEDIIQGRLHVIRRPSK